MPYSKPDLHEIGDALYNLIRGLQNGVGADDIGNLTSVLFEAADVVDEFKSSPKSAGIHVGARLMDRFGDDMVEDYT